MLPEDNEPPPPAPADAPTPAPEPEKEAKLPRFPAGAAEFRAAVIAGDGKRATIGRKIGYNENSVARRIAKVPELNAAYGEGFVNNSKPPSEEATFDRGPEHLNGTAPKDEDFEVRAVQDLKKYRLALKATGVSDETLNKLKALDGLAMDSARLLAVNFRVTHQAYVRQLHNLDEVADSIKARIQAQPPLDTKECASLTKVYVECVDQLGKGFGLMMDGAEALVRMEAAANGGKGGKGAGPNGKKPGWSEMKRVRGDVPPEA